MRKYARQWTGAVLAAALMLSGCMDTSGFDSSGSLEGGAASAREAMTETTVMPDAENTTDSAAAYGPFKTSSSDASGNAGGGASGASSSDASANAGDEVRPTKEESVTVRAAADGTAESIDVDVILSGGSGSTLRDVSRLSGIRNTEGVEEYTLQGTDTLLWQYQGEDIHYTGTATDPLPVTEKITYFLDGREIAPAELAGKSGRVRIRFDFKNHTARTQPVVRRTVKEEKNDNEEKGKDKEKNSDGKTVTEETVRLDNIAVPFTVITAVLLPEDTFSHVTVENGKVLSIDGYSVAVGMTLPGLSGSLDLENSSLAEDMELPEYVEIEADAENFALDFTASVISSGLLTDADLSGLEELETLRGDMVLLDEGMDEIDDALAGLEEGTGALLDGITAYANGASELGSGLAALSGGLAELDKNTPLLTQGTAALSDGLAQLSAAFPETPAMKDADAEELKKAAAALLIDIQELETRAADAELSKEKLAAIIPALSALSQKVADIKTAIAGLKALETQITESGSSASAAIGAARDTLTDADGSLAGTISQAASEKAGAAALAALADTELSEEEKAAIAAQIAANTDISAEAGAAITDAHSQASGLLDQAQALTDALAGAGGITDGLPEDELDELAAGLSELLAVLDPELAGRTVSDASRLEEAAKTAGIPELLEDMKKQLLPFEKITTTEEMEKAIDTLLADYENLKGSVDALKEGSASVNSGLALYAEGISRLRDAAGLLSSGSQALGDGGGALTEGAKELNEGAAEFREGFKEFEEEGFSEMSDLVNGDLSDLADRITAIRDADRVYDNYSGLADGTKGSVRFVIETASIEANQN